MIELLVGVSFDTSPDLEFHAILSRPVRHIQTFVTKHADLIVRERPPLSRGGVTALRRRVRYTRKETDVRALLTMRATSPPSWFSIAVMHVPALLAADFKRYDAATEVAVGSYEMAVNIDRCADRID